MQLNKYQRLAMRTYKPDHGLTMPALGLCGEAGEYADEIKKIVHHDKPISVERLVNELGDVLWYVAAAAESIGVTLDEVAQRNVEKLAKRYPEGYSHEASAKRADVERPTTTTPE